MSKTLFLQASFMLLTIMIGLVGRGSAVGSRTVVGTDGKTHVIWPCKSNTTVNAAFVCPTAFTHAGTTYTSKLEPRYPLAWFFDRADPVNATAATSIIALLGGGNCTYRSAMLNGTKYIAGGSIHWDSLRIGKDPPRNFSDEPTFLSLDLHYAWPDFPPEVRPPDVTSRYTTWLDNFGNYKMCQIENIAPRAEIDRIADWHFECDC